MTKTMILVLLCPILLTGCKHEPVEVDPQTKALAAARDLYMNSNRDAIHEQAARMAEESPQLASYLILSDLTIRVLERCEEVCTPILLALPGENTNTVITDICRGESLGDRIDRCGRHSDPDDYDSCVTNELQRGVCP